jgi:signal transduction histidine kinase/HAMP domain-containing protein
MHRSRERRIAGPILAVAVAVLAVGWMLGRGQREPRAKWVRETRQAYAELCKDLRQEAAAAAAAVGGPAETPSARLAAFNRLAAIEVREEKGRRALLLLDPDGGPVAWAGEGLLHELTQEVPHSGFHYRASFSAVTLLAIQPLDPSRRPWRVVVGASFPSDIFPFHGDENARWTLIDSPAQAVQGAEVVTLQGAPALAVERNPAARHPSRWPPADRLAWAVIGFALLSIAVLRFLHVTLPGGGRLLAEDGPARLVSHLAVGGLIALGAALAVSPAMLGVLVAGLAVTALGVGGRSREGDRVPAWLKGAGSVLALLAAAWGLQQLWGPLDLADGILVSEEAFTLRLGLTGAAFGLLCLAGRRKGRPASPRDRVAWIAVALLLAGATLCDQPLLGIPLLVAGGAAAAAFANQRRLGEGLAFFALILMAAFAAAGAWETAYRLRLQTYAGSELLSRLAPPTRQEIGSVAREIRGHFEALDLERLVPRSPVGLERQDLAYALWKDSPLARQHSLSALVVQTDGGPPSSFSFGMPLTDQGLVDDDPGRWVDLRLPLWEDFLISGVVPLRFGGRPWGRIRYWLLPRPGFEIHDWQRLSEVDVGLLKGPVAGPVEEIAQPALYALYTPDGRASLSPWEEEPPLSPRLRQPRGRPTGPVVEVTPSGPARAWSRLSAQGWEVVYLPLLRPLQALERTGNWSVGVVLLLALAAPPLLLLALPGVAFRDLLRRTVRSYSKRLMIVYTVLLLIPLLLLYFVLVRSMEERLRRDQQAAGEAALNSAQQLLGQSLLTMPPGFGVDTVFGDQLLIELSGIVRHEVNLYWGSAIHASSRHELFTAGLLPKRIPGEIYRRLALLGYGLSSRTNRVGDTTYLEMYAPLRVPGGSPGSERLFLSVPLLAQQEEAARQLGQLRRQGLLVTAALFALLVAVGRRLASNFTRPLMQLVEGTRQIAAGAPSLDLAPTELELASLVEAVDEMARRIAEGRERLLREKQVVERMVENITSGVVSLDRDRRVLMHNRVAAELLGTEVGHSLEEAVARSEQLKPVADFLRTAGPEMARATVRLRARDGGGEREWSLIWVTLPGSGEPSALLVAEDATEVLRGQRLLAWAEMARMIAHEIKNPLTPIRLSAEHMMEVYRHDPDHFDRVFERCTSNILTQVDELRSIASEFSAYSSIPRIDPQPTDLVASMADLVEGYRAAPPPGVSVEFEAEPGPLVTRFDARLLHRAVRNLIENALRASAGGGRVVVRVEQTDGFAKIAVEDSGPGVPPDLLPRIFDPYFSTHDTGTGLGLPIARRIAEEHGGDITARNRPEGGLEVVVSLPV